MAAYQNHADGALTGQPAWRTSLMILLILGGIVPGHAAQPPSGSGSVVQTRRLSVAHPVSSEDPDSVLTPVEESPEPRTQAFIAVRSLRALRRDPVVPIDLAAALSLAGTQNPELLLAQTRVSVAIAQHQLAAAQFLPTINLGTNYDGHVGVLQQPSGNILNVQRSALFFGAGANASGSGTVNIPGVVWNVNVTDAIYAALMARQSVVEQEFRSLGVRNEMLRQVVQAYLDLLETNAARSIRITVRQSSAEVARITQAFATTGEGRQADAERAATELFDRNALLIDTESQANQASAALAELIGLDQGVRYHPTDNFAVPHTIVPNELTIPEALAVALLQRPELQERRNSVVRNLLALDSAKLLPFSPNVFLGYSTGVFGGGSNLVSQPAGSGTFARGDPAFGNFGSRQDLDVMAYWSLQNLGMGNHALIDAAASHVRSAEWEEIAVLEQIRQEVALALRRSQIRLRRITIGEAAVAAAARAFQEDLDRIKGAEGLPIEVLDSLSLVEASKLAYLKAIMDYNRAQFDLYVALGQPPADMLARPASGTLPVAAPASETDDVEEFQSIEDLKAR